MLDFECLPIIGREKLKRDYIINWQGKDLPAPPPMPYAPTNKASLGGSI